MDLMFVLVLGTVAAGILLGMVVGKLMSRADMDEKVEQAFRRGKEEAEVEKANLAMSLGEQLVKIRDSIHHVAQAYDSTVRVVQENLFATVDRSKIAVGGREEPQLSLDFQPPREHREELPAKTFVTEFRSEEPLEADLAEEPAPVDRVASPLDAPLEEKVEGILKETPTVTKDEEDRFHMNGGNKNLPLQ